MCYNQFMSYLLFKHSKKDNRDSKNILNVDR